MKYPNLSFGTVIKNNIGGKMSLRKMHDSIDIYTNDSMGFLHLKKDGEDIALWKVSTKIPVGKKDLKDRVVYVLAESADDAIDQALCLGEYNELDPHIPHLVKAVILLSSAVRVPLMIRGWSDKIV